MILRACRTARRGAVLVESAIVYPLVFLLLLGLIVGGMGAFRYQEVAALAREGARWASVHGGQYHLETGLPAATEESIYKDAILPRATALIPEYLNCKVTWDKDNWPSRVVSDNGGAKGNTVSVTVTYRWLPKSPVGPITLSSTAVVPMAY